MINPEQLRSLGPSTFSVSPVSLGTWPIAGVKALDADSLATNRACFDLGINFIDTAYCYGIHGESENLLRRALERRRRDEIVLAIRGGIHYQPDGTRHVGGRPETIRRACDERLTDTPVRLNLCSLGPSRDDCAEDCCLYTAARAR